MKNAQRVTIKDVAREAGVSISTVSNALNNVDVLNPKTKAHVLKVAARLNYIPNQNGQNLRGKETKAIGLFVSEMTGTYYNILADTMHWTCQKYGYELYIYITNQCNTIINNIIGRRVDGAVILYEGVTDNSLDLLIQSERPVVFIDREIQHKKVASVVFDSFHEGKMATEYLISLGHKNLMHIYGLQDNFDSIRRYEGFLEALREANLSFCPENVLHGMFERAEAYREMKRFLSEGHPLPDAIFASNDLSAIGCFQALRDEGIRIPEDISLIGCDDIEMCELFEPPLTTIRTCFQSQGEIAIELLMDMLNNESEGASKKIEGQLVVRKSCRIK